MLTEEELARQFAAGEGMPTGTSNQPTSYLTSALRTQRLRADKVALDCFELVASGDGCLPTHGISLPEDGISYRWITTKLS